MIEIQEIKKIAELVFLSGRIKGRKPLSLIIVASAGKGKTEIITSFKGKNLSTITDLSYMGLIKIMKENPNIKHLIIPDFIKITNKKGSTSQNLISFLNNFIEDGVNKIKLYNLDEDFDGKIGGIVTATTKASLAQHRAEWIGNGFLSRLILVTYDYSEETMEKIQNFVANESSLKKDIVNIPISEVEIETDFSVNKKLIRFCKGNIRKQKQLQTLLKANALKNKRKKVNEEDLEEILKLTKFMNEKYTTI